MKARTQRQLLTIKNDNGARLCATDVLKHLRLQSVAENNAKKKMVLNSEINSIETYLAKNREYQLRHRRKRKFYMLTSQQIGMLSDENLQELYRMVCEEIKCRHDTKLTLEVPRQHDTVESTRTCNESINIASNNCVKRGGQAVHSTSRTDAGKLAKRPMEATSSECGSKSTSMLPPASLTDSDDSCTVS